MDRQSFGQTDLKRNLPTPFSQTRPSWMTHRLEKATFRIIVSSQSSKDSSCSANYISKFGHFLTARHCIEGCLKDSRLVEEKNVSEVLIPKKELTTNGKHLLNMGLPDGWQADMFEIVSYQKQKKFVHSKQIFPAALCDIKLGNDGSTKKAKIIYLPQGGWFERETQTDFSFYFPDLYMSYIKQNFEAPSDFVILKFQEVNKKKECLKFANRKFQDGEILRNTSFPVLGSFDVHRSYTLGYAHSPGLIDVAALGNYVYVKYPPIESKIFNLPKTFVSVTDGSSGSSGSAVLSEQNEILGIHHGLLLNYRGVWKRQPPPPGVLISVDGQSIREQALIDLGEERFRNIFYCED